MKKLGIISLVLLAALGITGVAYGAWTDTLNINSTAQTGYLDVRFGQAVSNDAASVDPTGPGAWTFSGGDLSWTGPVAATNEASTSVTSLSNLTLHFNVNGAYPGYNSSVGCTIENLGTVPVKIESIVPVITPPSGGSASDVSVSFSGALSTGAMIGVGGSEAGAVYINWNSVPAQSATYLLTVYVTVSQWNAVT